MVYGNNLHLLVVSSLVQLMLCMLGVPSHRYPSIRVLFGLFERNKVLITLAIV